MTFTLTCHNTGDLLFLYEHRFQFSIWVLLEERLPALEGSGTQLFSWNAAHGQ